MVGVGKPLILYIRCRIHRLEVLANSDQRDDWCNGSTATTRWYRFLIVVGGGSSPSSSPIDYFWIWLEAQRCLYAVFIRCDICLWRQAHILFLDYIYDNVLIMFLNNCCSSSVKIGCTIRICSSTVERRGHHPETGTSDSSQIHEEWKLWV